MPSIINVSGILIGFMATAKAILVSIQNRRVIQFLRESGAYAMLIAYIMSAIRGCFLVLVLSAAGTLVDLASFRWLGLVHLAIGFWVGVVVYAGVASYRIVHLVSKVLSKE